MSFDLIFYLIFFYLDEKESAWVFLQLSLPAKANQEDHLLGAQLRLPGAYKLVYSGSSGGGSGREEECSTSPQ